MKFIISHWYWYIQTAKSYSQFLGNVNENILKIELLFYILFILCEIEINVVEVIMFYFK